jgi:hypothetical protein
MATPAYDGFWLLHTSRKRNWWQVCRSTQFDEELKLNVVRIPEGEA